MPDQSETIQKLSVPRYAPRLKPTPIPTAAWNDEPLFCLQVNDEWVSHIIGALTVLDQPDTWLGDEDEIRATRQQVNEIILAFMEVCVNNCDCDIPLVRIENGVYQESDDGGITWHDAPTHDPRNAIPRIPPIPPPETDGAKCAYADSVVNHFKEGFIDLLEEGQTVEEIGAIITSIAEAVFGPLTGPIGWIVPAIFAIATAIVAFGITEVEAEFTTEFWNDLRCLIFNNMNDDGSFTNDQVSAIYDGLSGGTLALIIVHSWIAALGATGLTNAARLAMGSTSADCSGCGTGCFDTWNFYDGDAGTTITKTSAEWVIAAAIRGDAKYYVIVGSTGSDDCCQFDPSTPDLQDYDIHGTTWCGETPFSQLGGGGHDAGGGSMLNPWTSIILRLDTPFTVTLLSHV